MLKEGKLPEKKMVRSDVSGRLYDADDCEVIVFRIIKGKNEDVNDLFNARIESPVTRVTPDLFVPSKPIQVIEHIAQSEVVLPSRGPNDPAITKADLIGKTKLRTVIPPNLAGVFIDKDAPGAAIEKIYR